MTDTYLVCGNTWPEVDHWLFSYCIASFLESKFSYFCLYHAFGLEEPPLPCSLSPSNFLLTPLPSALVELFLMPHILSDHPAV